MSDGGASFGRFIGWFSDLGGGLWQQHSVVVVAIEFCVKFGYGYDGLFSFGGTKKDKEFVK